MQPRACDADRARASRPIIALSPATCCSRAPARHLPSMSERVRLGSRAQHSTLQEPRRGRWFVWRAWRRFWKPDGRVCLAGVRHGCWRGCCRSAAWSRLIRSESSSMAFKKGDETDFAILTVIGFKALLGDTCSIARAGGWITAKRSVSCGPSRALAIRRAAAQACVLSRDRGQEPPARQSCQSFADWCRDLLPGILARTAKRAARSLSARP